ncbi:MAG: hypothetical protein HFG70_11345 [Hungatella sp.]|nr:hypothetical protein [Hungatella sp.]
MSLGNSLFQARKRSGLSQEVVDVNAYVPKLKEMLSRLKREHGYGHEDAFLVLKDILSQIWTEPSNTP